MSPRVALAAPMTLLAAAVVPLAPWIWSRWRAPDGFFSHGPLVPLAAAWLAWSRRDAIARAWREGEGTWRALWFALPALALLLAASIVRVDSPALVALLALAAATVALVRGTPLLRALAVPFAFLLFAVPWPMELLADVVQALKLAVMASSSALLHLFGVGVEPEGAWLVLRDGERLLVDDECSGLSSAIALAALGAFMAASARGLPQGRRWLLLALSLPVALLANLARVVLLSLLAAWRGAAAVAAWHGATNALVYVVAIVAFVLLERLLAPRRAP